MTINDLPTAPAAAQRRQPTHCSTNREKRPREHLLEQEVRMMCGMVSVWGPPENAPAHEFTRNLARYGIRDAALILTMYKHGLRVSEACALDWAHVDLEGRRLTVHRAKGGYTGTHPIRAQVLQALRAIRRPSGPVFVGERGGRLTPSGVHKIVVRAGKCASIPFPVHAHMLRHACGYALADAGIDIRTIQQYLGHKNLSSTVIYTALSPRAFENVWLE